MNQLRRCSLLIVFLLSSSNWVSHAQSDNPDGKEALISRLLEITGAQYVNEELAGIYANDLKKYFSSKGVDVDDRFYSIVREETSEFLFESFVASGEFDAIYKPLYAGAFTQDELKQLINFYQSELGRKLVKVSNSLSQRGFQQSLEFANSVQPQIQKRLEDSLLTHGYDLEALSEQASGVTPEVAPPTEEELALLVSEKCAADGVVDTVKPLPVFRGPPAYPYFARLFGIEGWVELSFSVKKSGETSKVKVTNSYPNYIFDQNAMAAVKNYVFCPSTDSKPKQEIRIRFEMAK